MAATMATVNVVAVASTPMGSSFGGQRLVVGRGVGVAVRRPVQVRAETNSERYARKGQEKVEQGAGEAQNLGSKIANQAGNLKNKLFGAGKDVQKDAERNVSKARNAAGSTGKDAQKKGGNALGDLQDGLKDAVANVQDSFKGSKNAAASTGKDAEKNAGNALENIEQGLKDAVKKQQEIIKNKKDEILKNEE